MIEPNTFQPSTELPKIEPQSQAAFPVDEHFTGPVVKPAIPQTKTVKASTSMGVNLLKTFSIILPVLFILLMLGGAGFLLKQNQELRAQVQSLKEEKIIPVPSPVVVVSPTAVPQVFFAASSSPMSSVLPSATPSPIAKIAPISWAKFDFPDAKLVLYAPKNWNASMEIFPQGPSKLIRLWQGKDVSTTTIQLDIRDTWGDKGNQSQPRTFQVDADTFAYQADPPQASEKKLDRYETLYFFEKKNKVYTMECVHNWIPEQYKLCQDILTKLEFK